MSHPNCKKYKFGIDERFVCFQLADVILFDHIMKIHFLKFKLIWAINYYSYYRCWDH